MHDIYKCIICYFVAVRLSHVPGAVNSYFFPFSLFLFRACMCTERAIYMVTVHTKCVVYTRYIYDIYHTKHVPGMILPILLIVEGVPVVLASHCDTHSSACDSIRQVRNAGRECVRESVEGVFGCLLKAADVTSYYIYM